LLARFLGRIEITGNIFLIAAPPLAGSPAIKKIRSGEDG
jgi:hypothetical protein